jgi:hypothetical protein
MLPGMRAILLLILLSSCSTPTSQEAPAKPLNVTMDMAEAEARAGPPGDPCTAPFEGEPRPGSRAGSSAGNSFLGRDTGAWRLEGRVVGSGDFFFLMNDSNAVAPGSLLVAMQSNSGKVTSLMVSAAGGKSYDRMFEGPAWEAASTRARARQVKAVLIDFAKRAAGDCGAKLSSLDEEIASFDKAFAVFDRRTP